jgi:hypothetical protein
MQELSDLKTFFSEYFYSSPIPSCPLCKRHIMTKHYIATHIAIYCPEADRHPLPNSLLSDIYLSATNPKKSIGVRSVCKEWSSVTSIVSWCRHPDRGICYELRFQDNAVNLVPNASLLKSKSGRSISKQGYRLRKKNIIPEIASTLLDGAPCMDVPSLIESVDVAMETSCAISPINGPSVVQPGTSTPALILTTPPQPSTPLFPISNSIPSVYPGSAHPGSISYVVSRLTLSQQRIKMLNSSLRKWELYCVGSVKNVGLLVLNIENFAVSIIQDCSIQVSHKRNTLQNMMVFLRTLVMYENAQFVLIKANCGMKFLTAELRKMNLSINKLRAQKSTIEAQQVKGKWITAESIANISKQARLFTEMMISKFWNHSTTRFPALNRSTRTLFTKLTIADAKFFQSALLWRLFAIWTPQRSGRIVSLTYGGNLKYIESESKYLFIEELQDQKSSQARSRSLCSISIHEELTKMLDFNQFMIIPRLTHSPITAVPRDYSVFVNKFGNPISAESINIMITKLVKTIEPSATSSRVTCQILRRITQTQFYSTDPSIEEIDKFNSLADHSFQTSLLYYRLFKEASSSIHAMNRVPLSHRTIWG